jgi:hypothetical protein
MTTVVQKHTFDIFKKKKRKREKKDRLLHDHKSNIFHSVLCLSMSVLGISVLNKHSSKILQEALLNSVSNDLLPLMVGHNHDCFTLLSVTDVMLNRQQAIQVMYTGCNI